MHNSFSVFSTFYIELQNVWQTFQNGAHVYVFNYLGAYLDDDMDLHQQKDKSQWVILLCACVIPVCRDGVMAAKHYAIE